MKITIIGYYGYNNYGDDLMLFSLVEELLKENVSLNILVKNRPPSFLENRNNVNVYTFTENSKLENIRTFMRSIKNSQILLWGGGTCFTDEDGVSIRYFLIAKLLLKKIGFIGVGIGKVSGIRKLKTKLVLSISNLITARDTSTFEYFRKIGIRRNLFLGSDLSYLFNSEIVKTNENYLLISLHYLTNYLSEEEIAKRRETLINNIINSNKLYAKVRILPLCNEDFNENYKLFTELKEKGINVELCKEKSFDKRTFIISKSKFFYSERLHGYIISFFLDIKCMPLKYSR